MSEMALYNGEQINIGTCASMYSLRYEDRFKVLPLDHNINTHFQKNLSWRLPFPDEDNIKIGKYKTYDRGYDLIGFIAQPEFIDEHGTEYQLAFVKNTEIGVLPIIRSKKTTWCHWRCDWKEVLPYVTDEILKKRLEAYILAD